MKTFWTVCLLWVSLWADETDTTLRLYNKIVGALTNGHTEVRLYTDSHEIRTALRGRYRIVDTLTKADVAIVHRLQAPTGCHPIVFATSLATLEDNPDVVGALFWKKGRVQLLFIDRRLQQCGVQLPPFLQRYSIEAL